MIKIDPIVRKSIEALTDREVSYAFGHELMWYGIDALTQVYTMSIAKDVIGGRLAFEDFIKKYEIGRRKSSYCGFPSEELSASLRSLQSDGIFIPRRANPESTFIPIMWFDYANRVGNEYWPSDRKDPYLDGLIYRKWEVQDLQNLDMVNKVQRFGRDMWVTCVHGFRKYVAEDSLRTKRRGEFKKVTHLGEKLIEYYSSIIRGKDSE